MSSTSRRGVLRLGIVAAVVGAAGCLDDLRTVTDAPESETADGSETDGGDADSETIDGRLRNEDDAERVFDITITDESGGSRDGSFEVGPGETTRIPAVGSPGDVLAVKVTVGDATESETLELGGDAKPGELAGFVDVVYRADGEIEITFEPTD